MSEGQLWPEILGTQRSKTRFFFLQMTSKSLKALVRRQRASEGTTWRSVEYKDREAPNVVTVQDC